MKRKYSAKIITFILSVALLTPLFSGCAPKPQQKPNQPGAGQTEKAPADYSGTINMWSFTDEPKSAGFIDAFNKVYPNVKINLTVIPMESNAYSTKLASVLSTGAGVPDIFTSEIAFLKRFVNTDYYENLSQAPYNAEELSKNMVPYTIDLGRNDKDRTMRALSWQATPGGIYYRRSIAKRYLGTDDHDKISDMMKSMDDLLNLGKTLKDKSNGKVKLLAGYSELFNVALSSRKGPWVQNGALVIDKSMLDYIDISKRIRDLGIDAKIDQWTPAWSGAMAKDEVFGFVLPTWGLHYVIKTNAPNTAGDWGVAKLPTPYYQGGTWIGIYSKSKNKDIAWQFVKYITTNKDFLHTYALQKGDFVNNLDVIKQIGSSNEGKNDFVGGQNLYKIYWEMVPNITGKLVTQYDETINNKFQDNLKLYINGQKTRDQMIDQFKKDVKTAYPDLKVE